MSLPGFGPRGAKLMIVGEAFGWEEEKEGRPFVGRSGQQLRAWLMESGINPAEVYFDNLVNAKPPGNKLAKWCPQGKPNKQLTEGMLSLLERIVFIKPNLVLALGNFPMFFLTGKGRWTDEYGGAFTGIREWRGSILNSTMIPGQKVICSYHPAYLVREGMGEHGTFLSDLARVKEDMEFPELRYHTPTMLPNPKGHEKIMARERLLDSPKDTILTVDIEYITNKKKGTHKLICVGIGDASDWAASFPVDLPIEHQEVGEILMSGRPLNMQNSMFDASILEWHYGWPVQQFLAFDTMIAAHAANIELPKSLDYLSSIYTREPNHKGMINWKDVVAGKQFFADVYTYNCIDVWVQHMVMEQQWIWDLRDKRALNVFNFEMALLDPLWEVSKRGVRLDHKHLDVVRKGLTLEIQALNELLFHVTGRRVNVKSGTDVAWLMHEFLGIECTRRTKKKKTPKTDDKTLASYSTKCDERQAAILMTVRDIRGKRDLKSKFTDVELDDDKRSRGHYDPSKTVTGRLASKKFYPTSRGHQQQNIPRDPRIRSSFIPDEGKTFGYGDLERAESLVVAHLTNDPLMLAHHAPGQDAHTLLAALLFDIPFEEVTKEQRYMGKQTRHAGNYMEGPETMKQLINQKSHITGISVAFSDCDRSIKLYRSMHIYLEPWWDEIEVALWNTRVLENLLGRYRIFYDHIKSIIPEAVAFIPQSTVADITNCGVLACHGRVVDHMREHLLMTEAEIYDLAMTMKHDWGWEMLLQVHDAIGYQYDTEYTYEVNSAMRKLMSFRLQSPKSYEDFIIPVEVAIGPSWGGVEKWEKDIVT